jgi:hypothetical protein
MVQQRSLNIQVKKKQKKEKIANKRIKEEFTLKNTTIYGGYNLYSDHVVQGGLDRLLADELTGMKAPWATYHMPIVCRTLIDGYALGLENIYQFEGIERDPLITAKHALEKLPDQSVLRKDLINQFASDDDVNRLRRVKTKQVKNVLKHLDGNLVLEYDSTVETGYGSQEGLKVGYNPRNRGRASYHPQLCRERITGLSVWSRLRPGNTVSSSDFIDFLEESWRVIPKRFKRKKSNGLCKVTNRMDSGYECEGAMGWLEKRGVGYVIKMTMRGDIWSKISAIPKSKYRTIDTEVGQVQVVSLQFKRDSWSKDRRVVVIRWQEETNRAQTSLFDAFDYTYSVFVTAFTWDEEDIYRFYDKRADVENHIREAKHDFSIDHIATEHFYANAADLELKLLALNQILLFTKNILHQLSPRHFASTVRRKWLMIPAKLIKRSGSLILKLSDWHPYREKWSLYRENLAIT